MILLCAFHEIATMMWYTSARNTEERMASSPSAGRARGEKRDPEMKVPKQNAVVMKNV
jgi:hypothetical protein